MAHIFAIKMQNIDDFHMWLHDLGIDVFFPWTVGRLKGKQRKASLASARLSPHERQPVEKGQTPFTLAEAANSAPNKS